MKARALATKRRMLVGKAKAAAEWWRREEVGPSKRGFTYFRATIPNWQGSRLLLAG
jgi:hypothetical protein